ncbi:MAG: diguanylate cyclase domain-containing protein [Thermoleophilaceae bacterium]
MLAVTRLLAVEGDHEAPDTIRDRLVTEARDFFAARRVVLVSIDDDDRMAVVAANPDTRLPRGPIAASEFTVLRAPIESHEVALASGDEAARLDTALGSLTPARSVLALPITFDQDVHHVLVVADDEGRSFGDEEIEVARAFAAAASASLAKLRMSGEHAVQIAQQDALARAAKSLNESLDLNRVLVRICHEAASILDGDNAVVYRGDAAEGMAIEATYGMPPEAIGFVMEPGKGLSGKVASRDRSLLSNDYQGLPDKADSLLFGEVHSGMAVPMHWDGELRGVLSVGYRRDHRVNNDQLKLLEAFGELAAAACRNASAHAGLVLAARTDGLTGCLNHAAMHEALRREIQRSERSGHRLSLVLVDMDDFKQVNEEHGHLVGDEVLRRVGHALRQAVRPYDLVARYGGDEFAILTIDADEEEAREVADRSLDGVRRSLDDLSEAPGATGASAGVAEWAPGENGTSLIERADRALLFGKHEGERGAVSGTSQLPEDYRPGRFRRREERLPDPEAPVEASNLWPDRGREQTERLRKRTRQLALANALGTRLAGMTDPGAIIEAAVGELHRAFGYHHSALIRLRDDGYVEQAAGRGAGQANEETDSFRPREAGLIGRCLRERQAVMENDTRAADFESETDSTSVHAELAVPLWVGDLLWGAIDVKEARADAFDDDDARLVQTVADQVGAALLSANLYRQLDCAYIGTVQALAGALETTKDSYTADHSRHVVGRAQDVGRRLGLAEAELRTLRFAAIFHDIGKVAVQDEVLAKSAPLTAAERSEIEAHTLVAERILASVEFLSEVLPLVRHEHERWDGRGYPDGLAGESIPLGARIVLACDAYDAMITDRPYRSAMTATQARAELMAGAGSQFDERVVAALLQVLDTPSVTPR